MGKNKEDKKEKKKHPSRQKPPQIDKLMMPAIGVGLALLAYNFMKGINSEVRGWLALAVTQPFIGFGGSSYAGVIRCFLFQPLLSPSLYTSTKDCCGV